MALAFLSALLFTMGYAFDDAHLRSLHLPVEEYMPPAYLEIAKPFDLLFVSGQSDFKIFRAISFLMAGIGILSLLWPRFRLVLARMLTIMRLVPFRIFFFASLFGILALSNWLVNYAYTTADNEFALARADWNDWSITLKDRQTIPCHFVAASSANYAVIIRSGDDVIVQTIPKDAVATIGHNTNIH